MVVHLLNAVKRMNDVFDFSKFTSYNEDQFFT